MADLIAAGEKAYAKCQSCHTIAAGGANGVGPNLHAIMGAQVAAKPGFAYSNELKALGGQWDWEKMDAWLKNPKGYVPGTKMGFAGLSKVGDRAAISAYLNAQARLAAARIRPCCGPAEVRPIPPRQRLPKAVQRSCARRIDRGQIRAARLIAALELLRHHIPFRRALAAGRRLAC